MMAFVRNGATNLFPMILGLFLEINGTSARVLATLSNAGACVSISTLERLKKILSVDARRYAVMLMKTTILFYLIFDNINLYLRKSQQRLFNKNTMIHATNAAVVSLPDATPEAFNLEAKLARRGKRAVATGADIELTDEDQQKLSGSFEGLVILFVLSYTPGSSTWKCRAEMQKLADSLMASDRPLPVRKTDARPLGVFDVNEGSKKGIIQMLKELQVTSEASEEDWASEARIMQGDWLTSSNVRAARKDRTDDVNAMERLEYTEENSALWHFALNATHMLMRIHFGNAMADPGSLAKHKGLLNRNWDAAKPNYADAKALIRHSLIARILYTVMLENGMKSWRELAQWQPTPAEVGTFAHAFVKKYTLASTAEDALDVHDDYLAHSVYFMRDALIFCEFERAVSQADAGPVLRVLKCWALSFRGAGLHNYARECVEVLLRWKYELDDAMRTALEQSWFVNRWGLPGRWIPADLYLEQLNFWVKRVFIAKGSGVSVEYIIEKGSACVEAFREISHSFARTFGHADRARRHKEVDVGQDLRLLTENMLHARLHVKTPDRPIYAALPKKTKKNTNATTTPRTAIVDALDTGAEAWNDGKFTEYLRTTTWDPALGYPVGSSTIDDVLLNGTAFDQIDNPLSVDAFDDTDDGDDHAPRCTGLGSLGGGMEFSDHV
ncbi:hypothetical protein BV25DRAFT_795265 [Artomyces pyxidatus]|uniref:Uncharacterized protein n=1 Tax=Artomyces pyxidatus TaxID=48021 RepID=A0ACB8SXK5_9AGAM|nr:hypothetical protein BV25DRAFT_795265 [Artomyces pyxidatus]